MLHLTKILDRSELANVLGSADAFHYSERTDHTRKLPVGAVRFGKWSASDDNDMPDLIICNSGEQQEVVAWLVTYFPNLSPITQWCRVISVDEINKIRGNEGISITTREAFTWANLILGECFSRLQPNGRMQDLPLAAALSSSTFVYARSKAVWGNIEQAIEVVAKWENIQSAINPQRGRQRDIQLLPFWRILEILNRFGEIGFDSSVKLFDEADDFLIVRTLSDLRKEGAFSRSRWLDLCQRANSIGTNVIFSGSQQERLRDFDRVAEQLRQNKGLLADFTMAYAAASVVGGKLRNIDLLQGYTDSHPTAPMWFALIASIIDPTGLGAEFNGFGRQIAKELLWKFELSERPRCDLSIEELMMIAPTGDIHGIGLRGFSRSAIMVELQPGVCAALSSREKNDTSVRVSNLEKIIHEELQYTLSENFLYTIQDVQASLRRLEDVVRYLRSPNESSSVKESRKKKSQYKSSSDKLL